MNPGQLTLIASTFCVMLTMHFSIELLSQHLLCWKKPKEQKAIVIIILMAPIYAIDSYVGLLDFQRNEAFFMFLESIKECYEALVIVQFLALLYSYLNISISKNVVPDGVKGRESHHSFPMNLFQSVRDVSIYLSFLGHFVNGMNNGLHSIINSLFPSFVASHSSIEPSYVEASRVLDMAVFVIRPVCSILMITLQLLGLYSGWISWTFTIILNISVSLALYSLVVFYHVFAKELKPHKPIAKFLWIKGIVFFCFWQGVLLDILVALRVIRSHHFWLDVEHVKEGLQNALVCVEMVFFFAFQQYAYNVKPYRDEHATSSMKLEKMD